MAQVALLIETALRSGREIIQGIAQFVHEREDWQVFHYTGSLGAMDTDVLEHWEGDGIIARINNEELLEVIKNKQVPVVDVLGNVAHSEFACVKSDNDAIAKLVFDHFYERGFKNYSFVGRNDESWSSERELAFRALVNASDCSYNAWIVNQQRERFSTWNQYIKKLSQWLKKAPKPLSIFVSSDQFAPDITNACSVAGLRIPDDVALIGVDNDPVFCEVTRPSLSSVDANHKVVGYDAAVTMESLLSGSVNLDREKRISPQGIFIRQSSDAFAIDDEGLQTAMRAIRKQACEGINVDEIAKISGYSRSVLQRRFRSKLGRTVHDAILATKLTRAKELLTITNLPLIEVSHRSGFNHQEYLNHVFKTHVDMTPGDYRKRFTQSQH